MRPTVVAPPKTKTSIEELVDDYLVAKRGDLAAKSHEQYRYALQAVFLPFLRKEGITEPDDLDSKVLTRLSAHLLTHGTEGLTERPRGALAKDTVHSYLRPVRWFCNWANRPVDAEGGGAGVPVPGRVPLPKLKPQRVFNVLTREEIVAMARAAADRGHRDELILEVLTSTGMRAGELTRLRPQDLRRTDGGHFLFVQGKGDRDRLVPIIPKLYRALTTWGERMQRETKGSADTRLFMSLRRSRRTGEYEPLTPSGVLQIIKAIAEAAGIQRRVYVHLLRHSFATAWLQQPKAGPAATLHLKTILGHADLTMIDRHYGHLTSKDAYNAMLEYLKR